jgi:nitroreductase
MEFFETVERRRSVRSYKDKAIEKEKLTKLLEIINKAPSAGNLQAYKVVIVKTEKTKRSLASAAFGQEFIAEAPVVLVFLADAARSAAKYGERGASLYALQDATIAAAYAQLAATALGLGSVWVGAFDENAVSMIVGAERWQRPIAIIPIGYPAEEPEQHERKRLSEMVREI